MKIVYALVFALFITGCSYSSKPNLHGFYQSDKVDGYSVQMSFDYEDNSFVKYIDNRKVNEGMYSILDNDTYELSGDTQSLEIILKYDNSFEIIINKLNEGEPIKLKNIGTEPTYFESNFDDVSTYKSLLD